MIPPTETNSAAKIKLKTMEKCKRFIKNNLLLVLLLCSLCLGIGLGAAMRSVELNDREKMYFRSI